ncbi:type I restriction endonuclease subunit S [Rhodoferax lacus]|uniref:Type I restriction endonuclease subunit S n=1 Tax=Rhodoferax lacus TaxID=2184758 RepID=A0A3E1R6M0_9BURK|nr:restriction endonuclease subunit S [Rhodoferax lacus]RFO94702.1 type I restriction endonuclease subunit S [Rhodoferax lacus]
MLISNLDLLATAPGGVAKLRELILTLAVQGKLVPQDPNDEPASELLKKIRAEKDRLIAEGKIKRDKPVTEIRDEEKPFELPQSWEWVRFGDASINRDGERIPVSSSDRDNRAKTYDYYGASGVIDKIDGYLFDKTLLLIGEDGANLINRSTPIAFLAHGKYWVNNHAHVIDTTNPELITYLALFINAISLEPYVTGTAQPKMNQAKLNSIVIALPPLAEQSRIVTRVEELMLLCDALEAKGQLEATQHAQLVSTLLGTLTESETPEELAETWQRIATHFDLLLDRPESVDALEQTILQLAVRGLLVPQDQQDEPASELLKKVRAQKDKLIAEGRIKRDIPMPIIEPDEQPFALPQGWTWARLESIFQVITDGDHLPPPVSESGVAFLTIGNISSGLLNFDGCRFVPKDYFDEIAEYRRPARGDILYTVVGASYGRAVLVETDRDFCVQRHIGILKPSVEINLQYLASLLASQFIYEQATRSLTGTAQLNRPGFHGGPLG